MTTVVYFRLIAPNQEFSTAACCMSSMEEQCDQITHCRDESDKDNFKLTEYKDNHNSKVPDERARHLRVQSHH